MSERNENRKIEALKIRKYYSGFIVAKLKLVLNRVGGIICILMTD